MTALALDLYTYSDADLVESFIYQLADGTPIDLTGYSMHLHVRHHASDATAMFECSTVNGRIWFNDIVNGAFTLQIPVAVLMPLTPGTYAQSLIIAQPVSLLRRDLWRGSLIHAAGPTRWDLGTL